MRNKDNVKFVIALLLLVLPFLSEWVSAHPTFAWASSGLGSVMALLTNARGVFLVRTVLNFFFPQNKFNDGGLNDSAFTDDEPKDLADLVRELEENQKDFRQVLINREIEIRAEKANVSNNQLASHGIKDLNQSLVDRYIREENLPPLDGKVSGILFSNKNGHIIPADEFVVFRPQDNAFFNILSFYRAECYRLGAKQIQLEAIDRLIEKIKMWRDAHPDRCKVPDCQPGETPQGW